MHVIVEFKLHKMIYVLRNGVSSFRFRPFQPFFRIATPMFEIK
jgi:hypothetical protein